MTFESPFLAIALVSCSVAAVVTHLLVPLAVRVAVGLDALDLPGQRKLHGRPTPRLGGLALVAGLAAGSATVFVQRWEEFHDAVQNQAFLALALGAVMIFAVGVADDVSGVSVLWKLLIEVLAAWLLVSAGWRFEVLAIPGTVLELGAAGGAVTILWIVGVTNAINFIDGLDGLASGVVAIISASFLVFVIAYQSPLAVALTGALVGACLGFLRHNWEPARIFLGDAGSLTAGFLLASLSVFTTLKSPAVVAILIPILALGVPVIDTLLVMIARFLENPGTAMVDRTLRVVKADRNHLHHVLEDLIESRRSVVRLIYLMVLISCGLAALVALTKRSEVGLLLVLVEAAAIFAVRRFGMARRARSMLDHRG